MLREKQTAQIGDQILDATEAVIGHAGVSGLTLDAVAAQAKISKGGLLHHYPSKDALVRGLVARCATECKSEFERVHAATPLGPGRTARAMLTRHLAERKVWDESMRRTSAALMAVLAQDHALMKPMLDNYHEILRLAEDDGLCPGVAEIVIAAIDGLWLWWLSGIVPVTDERFERMHRALEMLIGWCCNEAENKPRTSARTRRTRAASTKSTTAPDARVRVGKSSSSVSSRKASRS